MFKLKPDMEGLMSSAEDSRICFSPRDDGKVDFLMYLLHSDGSRERYLELFRATRSEYVGGGCKYRFEHMAFKNRGIPGGRELVDFADSRRGRGDVDVEFTIRVNPRSAIGHELPDVPGIGPFWTAFCDYAKHIDGARRTGTAKAVKARR